jgi:hypothetical protein
LNEPKGGDEKDNRQKIRGPSDQTCFLHKIKLSTQFGVETEELSVEKKSRCNSSCNGFPRNSSITDFVFR